MVISFLALLGLGLMVLLVVLLLVAALCGGRIAYWLVGGAGVVVLFIMAGGSLFLISARHQAAEAQKTRMIHEVVRQAELARNGSKFVSSSHGRPIDEIIQDGASRGTSAAPEDTDNPGKTLGRWAGSLYQELRNQVKSADDQVDPSRIIPPGRPDWVEQPMQWNSDGTCQLAISSGPYDRTIDCQQAIDTQVEEAVGEFANELLGDPRAAQILASDLHSLHKSVVAETYQEQLTPSIGVMHQWHALLKFDQSLQQKLRELWRVQQQVSRLVYAVAGFVGLLGLMMVGYVGLALMGRKAGAVAAMVTSVGLVGIFLLGVIFVRTFPMV